ncbi:MAG: hypothetical protein ACLUEK_02360 [Oscillospiraceae bacterium]
MGYLAIVVGFVVLVVLCMMNVHVMISAFAAAFVVTIIAGLPITESLITVFFTRFGSIVASLFPMFLFGAVLAKLYTSSGAASSIADSICNAMFRGAKTDKGRYALGFLTVITASAILCYGGINAAVALIAIYPIAIGVLSGRIPKRFIMGAICGGAFTFALSGPGSPQPTNVVGMAIGTSSYCGLVAGIVGMIVEICVMLLVFTRMTVRATARGETFVAGPKDVFAEDTSKPRFLVSLIPIIALLIIFNVLGVDIALSILITSIIAALVFLPQLGFKGVALHQQRGGLIAGPCRAIAAVNGFAAVIQSLPEYQQLIDGMLQADVPAVVLLVPALRSYA